MKIGMLGVFLFAFTGAILCASSAEQPPRWDKIAKKKDGIYFVETDGHGKVTSLVVVVSSPMLPGDKELQAKSSFMILEGRAPRIAREFLAKKKMQIKQPFLKDGLLGGRIVYRTASSSSGYRLVFTWTEADYQKDIKNDFSFFFQRNPKQLTTQ